LLRVAKLLRAAVLRFVAQARGLRLVRSLLWRSTAMNLWARKVTRSVERLVGAEVHRGEWRLVLLFFANLFLLLSAYYILKVIREPLILMEGGAVERSYARGAQAGLLLLLIPAYGILANCFEPARLVKWIMGVFVLSLVVFVTLGQLRVRVGFPFFVWLGIFSTLAIAQFWSLATDVMSEADGKRLFPMVAAGGTLGGIFGSQIAARLIDGHPHQLMGLAAAILLICALLTHLTYRVAGHGAPVAEAGQEWNHSGGFTLLLRDRYLLLIALSVLILNFVNTTGDFLLAQLVNTRAQLLPVSERRAFIGAFYGDFQTYISVLTSLVQILVVTRVFKALGIGGSLLLLPVFALAGYGVSAIAPLLGLVATIRVVENSTDYSLQNTIQQALFLPTSREAKYKAKAAIDTMFVRLGDLASTALVFVGARVGLGVSGYALANVLGSLAWVWVAYRLRRLSMGAPGGMQGAKQAPLAA
jgi:AAA family ATP:ADP antiporter